MEAQEPTQADGLVVGRISRRQALAGMTGGLLAATAPNVPTTIQGGKIMAQQVDETAHSGYLAAPGAQLYYEVSGTGPVLLLIPGGMADASGFAPLASFLEEHYTVVRYDPRGISHSKLDGAAEDVPVEVHADDASRLLMEIGSEPAFVLGHSGGAVIGLALVERHPELVQTYVAHEPPLTELLPEGDARRTANQEIYDTYLKEGPGPAMAQFMALAGLDEAALPGEMSPEAQEFMAEQMASIEQNLDFFFAHYLMPITVYVPDTASLKEASSQIVVGVGEASVGLETYDTSLALAELLGTEVVQFPGDHVGSATHPQEFAETLHEVLQAS